MVRRMLWIVGLLVLWAFSGWTQTYGPGEIYYGGIRLQFSGRVLTAGTCTAATQPAPGVTQIRCQVPEGVAETVELTATRTPAEGVNIRVEPPVGWPSSLWTQQLGQWVDSRSAVASGWGTVTAQYRFTPPAGSAGRQFTLRFKAWTAGVMGELELRLILDIVRPVTPTPPPMEPTVPPSYGPFTGTTDATGQFEVPIPTVPNTSVTGKLTECTVKPLPRTQVSVALVPKPGVTTVSRADQIGAVRVSSPGYIETEIVQLQLASSMDLFGRTYTTVGTGTVCLRPTAPPVTPPPVTPTYGPVTGKTDGDGQFTTTIGPGTTVTGRLTECTVRPLPNQGFTLTPIPKGEVIVSLDDVAGFTFSVPGYAETTVTKFSTFSLFGLTSFLLGDVQVFPAELPWTANRPLTWDDFGGDPPQGAEDGDEAAKIVMWLGYSFKTRTWFDKGTGKWKAHLTEVTTTNTMDRSQSWVVPGKKTPALLGHEQKHFDLNEVYRRLLDAALQKLVCSLEATGDTEEEAEENLDKKLKETFDKVNKKCDEVQEQYDKETDHGRNADKQKEWDKKIADWLTDPTKAPQP